MRTRSFAQAPVVTRDVRFFRRKVEFLFARMCPRCGRADLSLPLFVVRKRFVTELFDFIFGIGHPRVRPQRTTIETLVAGIPYRLQGRVRHNALPLGGQDDSGRGHFLLAQATLQPRILPFLAKNVAPGPQKAAQPHF